jgi:hypothetical protein
MRLAQIEKKLEAVELVRKGLLAEQAEALGRKIVTCTNNCWGEGCGKKTQIRSLVFIQTHYYVTPHGCNGGDYWVDAEGQFDCLKCGHRNRLHNRPYIAELRPYFASIRNEHDRGR